MVKRKKPENTEGLKSCGWCHKWQSISNFNTNAKTGKPRCFCKKCQPKADKSQADYQRNNAAATNAKNRKWAHENKDKVTKKQQRYKSENRSTIQKREREKYASNPIENLKVRLRARLRHAFKKGGKLKACKTEKMLGCTAAFCVEYLKSQLPEGEDLNDYEIDHIFPLAKYDPDEVMKMTHYSNLQPLIKSTNNSKGCKMPTKEEAMKVQRQYWPRKVSEADFD